MQWLLGSFASGLCLGIIVAEWLAPVGEPSLAAWPAMVLLGCVGLAGASRRVRRAPWFWLLAMGFSLALSLHLQAPRPRLAPECVGESVLVTGTVVDGARPLRDGRARLTLELQRCGERQTSGRVDIVAAGAATDLVRGDTASMRLDLAQTRGAVSATTYWPGRKALARRIAGRGYAGPTEAVERLAAGDGLLSAIDRFRVQRERALIASVGEGRAAPVLALATGSRGLFAPSDRRPFDLAGLSHLLAISGLHLMTVALLGSLLQRLAIRWGHRWARRRSVQGALVVGSLALVVAYATLAGWPISARRAMVMLVCWRAAQLVGREASLEVALALAVTGVLLGESTHALFDPALQLSASAVAGIAIAHRGAPAARARWRRWVGAAAAASLASNAACAPWLALHFGRIPLLGVVLNLIAVPAVQLVALPLSFAALLAGDHAPGPTLAIIVAEVLEGIGGVARVWPVSGLGIGLASALVAAAGVTSSAWCLWRQQHRTALAVLFVATLAAGLWAPKAGLEVRFLPVGEGDSILVRDGSASMLIDGGGHRHNDPGRRVVVPALRRAGIRRLDVVLVTHTDLDHAGGLVAVIEEFEPRELWWGGAKGTTPLERRILAAARNAGTVVRPAPSFAMVGALKVRRLNPGDPFGFDRGLNRNERSTVVEIELGDLRMLAPGDVEALGEWRVQRRLRPVHLLKAPHHGSRSSSSQALLDGIRPRWVVVQSGEDNQFGHPHPVVVERYRRSGARIYSTATCGEVVVRVQQKRASVSAYRHCYSLARNSAVCGTNPDQTQLP